MSQMHSTQQSYQIRHAFFKEFYDARRDEGTGFTRITRVAESM